MKFKFAPQSSQQILKTELPALSSPLPPSPCAHMLHLSHHLVRVVSLQSPPPSLVPINHHDHHRNNGLRKPQLGRAHSHHRRGFHVKTSPPANPETHRWKGALGEAGGKACPSRLSKYPAGSPQGACGHSLNSFKVPFICSKSRTVFVQGLLLLDKSLAPVQAWDYVRMFRRPQQGSIAQPALPAGPLLVTRIPIPARSVRAQQCNTAAMASHPHFNSLFLEEAPTPSTR